MIYRMTMDLDLDLYDDHLPFSPYSNPDINPN
jgi:hypothetical protein